MFTLEPKSPTPLVEQIVEGLRRSIERGRLRVGAKLPSIRQLAQTHRVSTFTVVEAYDRLIAQGHLVSRPNAGFFVRRRQSDTNATLTTQRAAANFDSSWYLRQIFENRHLPMRPGCGWLPADWLFEEGIRRGLRALAASHIELAGYGDPKGYVLLRQHIRDQLAEREIGVATDAVLLTQGSSQALDLAARRLVRAGDAVLVDQPGYANLLGSLRFLGAQLIGVERTPQGYDLEALERSITAHRPRVFFTQPRLHSPTGSTASLASLHGLLRLADRHDITIVENDLYAELDAEPRATLASLDQLARVIYIGSFSKTVSPNLRVGYVVARNELIEDMAQLKLMSGLTSSDFGERIAYSTVTDSRWRKHLKLLRERLGSAHERAVRRLVALGFELFAEPGAGMFVWARHPQIADAAPLSQQASEHGILLGPGHLFSPTLAPSPWLRFNVAHVEDERIFDFLAAAIARGPDRASTSERQAESA